MDSFHLASPFGEQLKTKRIAMHLSIETISDHFKLPVRVFEQLEESNPGDLPSIFMKGYLKQYARYLNFSDEDISAFLTAFQALASEKKNSPTKKLPCTLSYSKRPRGLFIPIFSGFIAIALMALSALWWYNPTPDAFPDVKLMLKSGQNLVNRLSFSVAAVRNTNHEQNNSNHSRHE